MNGHMQAAEVCGAGGRRDAGPAIVSAVIPCVDEEDAIATVVAGVLACRVSEVIVVDGCSRDHTVERAKAAGARVVIEPRHGYGRAIQVGVAAARREADILLFLDGDGSDPLEFIPELIAPIVDGRAVFVQGSRIRGKREPGSLSPQQIAAGYIGGILLRLLYGLRVTDLSPFRAIRRETFHELGMAEMTYGWNLEMLMRLAATRLPALEIPVGQRRRAGGVSKVSGNLVASLKAAWSIAETFLRLALILRRRA
jgi:glycosyltransferase involved in cell wall biosynthesis